MKNIIAVLTSITLFMLTFFSVRSVAGAQEGSVSSLISDFRIETKNKNVSVVIYDNGEISYYGDKEGLYQIGSMTKAFTGLAVRKLITDGIISEDDKVSKYIPGFTAYFDGEEVDITVKNLLEQKSGYTNNENDYPSATAEMTLSEWVGSVSGKELRSKPGSGYAYSNVNYNLLGLIVENVTGKPYREYMENEILLPLGLTHTSAGVPSEGKIIEGQRPGYRHSFAYPIAVREASVPAGYFYSNVEDMGRWIAIWTGDAEVPEGFENAISKVKGQLKSTGDYDSGWELFDGDIIGHSGGTPNYSSRIVFSEDKKTGVCVLTDMNVASSTDSLCNAIYDKTVGAGAGKIARDIWTIFDIIFTAVAFAGAAIFVFMLFIRKRPVLLVTDIALTVLLVLILILFPVIFGAGIKAIVGIWAPLSLGGGLLVLAADIIMISLKLIFGRKNAGNKKTGKGQAAYGHN
ncbi:MAG: beta-lactamase family protein [Lachnospiraceae bacterium]|nr:beta-lactamase family protein [Lachnospiraceae bacterium]